MSSWHLTKALQAVPGVIVALIHTAGLSEGCLQAQSSLMAQVNTLHFYMGSYNTRRHPSSMGPEKGVAPSLDLLSSLLQGRTGALASGAP